MCLCAVLALVLGIGSARFVAACGNGLAAEIRKAEYAKIQSFSFANRDRFRTESLVTRLTSDVTTIQNAIISGMRPGVRGPFMMVMSIAMGFAINPKLAVIFLIAAPVLAIFLVQIVRRVGPLYSTMQGAIDQVNRVVQELSLIHIFIGSDGGLFLRTEIGDAFGSTLGYAGGRKGACYSQGGEIPGGGSCGRYRCFR